MAEHEEDPGVSRRYRALGREEPPQELDAAILAEARRETITRPAPLVPPTGRRRWYFPVAAAAIIVLAVAVTVQMEGEQGDPESPIPSASSPSAVRAPTKEAQTASPAARRAQPELEAPRRAERSRAPKPESQPSVAPPPQPPAADAAERRADQSETASAAGAPAARAPSASPNLAIAESPAQQLERIAKLREERRDDEADQALKDFRKRYPDFRISEEMLKRVERR